jgi:hypothetical protein
MGQSKSINGVFLYSFRGSRELQPKHVEVQISQDGVNWTTEKVLDITKQREAAEVSVKFDNPVTTQFFKVIVDQVYIWTTADILVINEIDIF